MPLLLYPSLDLRLPFHFAYNQYLSNMLFSVCTLYALFVAVLELILSAAFTAYLARTRTRLVAEVELVN